GSPTTPRLFSSSASDSSTPRRSDSSVLMNRAMTFLPLKVPAGTSGAFQVDVKLLPAEAQVAAAANTAVAHRERIDRVMSSPRRAALATQLTSRKDDLVCVGESLRMRLSTSTSSREPC